MVEGFVGSRIVSDYWQEQLYSPIVPKSGPMRKIITLLDAAQALRTPSWTLLAWKGPGINTPMVAASGTRTHLLQLALGPSTPSARSSRELDRIIQNQTIFLSRP